MFKRKRYWYFNSIVTYNFAKTLIFIFFILAFLSIKNILTQTQRNDYGLIWGIVFLLNMYIDYQFLDDDWLKPKKGESRSNIIRFIKWIYVKIHRKNEKH